MPYGIVSDSVDENGFFNMYLNNKYTKCKVNPHIEKPDCGITEGMAINVEFEDDDTPNDLKVVTSVSTLSKPVLIVRGPQDIINAAYTEMGSLDIEICPTFATQKDFWISLIMPDGESEGANDSDFYRDNPRDLVDLWQNLRDWYEERQN
jgi:hypothetical protein